MIAFRTYLNNSYVYLAEYKKKYRIAKKIHIVKVWSIDKIAFKLKEMKKNLA